MSSLLVRVTDLFKVRPYTMLPVVEDRANVAELIIRDVRARGVRRVFGLCGGHIQPLWDAAVRLGLRVIDVRHEGAAVTMAHADAFLTGELGVALVTAGPGLTNALTGIANAHASNASVLVIAGLPPRPQAGRGAMQELPQRAVVAPLCRTASTLNQAQHATAAIDEAVRAARGFDGPPGPAYVGIPTDVLETFASARELALVERPHAAPPALQPAPEALDAAEELIVRSRRPLVIAGRIGAGAEVALAQFLDVSRSLYLDTAESRGVLSPDHPAAVPAVRGRAMSEADLVITLGRRLNFQLGYGSPAVFAADAKFLRIGASSAELADNRSGDAEVHAESRLALAALATRAAKPANPDTEWGTELRAASAERTARHRDAMATRPPGEDGRMHPDRLISAVNAYVDDQTITVADGGDILSFARVGLAGRTYLDSGTLGCLGVGVPFATAAAIVCPGRRVVAVIGDGSFGFTAIEIDTAVRHDAKVVFVVANNEAWNIERKDQAQRYEGRLVGVDLPGCRYDRLGEALGARGRRVSRPDELPDALAWAFANAPAVLDVLVTRDAESADFRSGLAQVPPRQALTSWDRAEAALAERA
jgi:acetolactate synthase-1/2/3 large subunit